MKHIIMVSTILASFAFGSFHANADSRNQQSQRQYSQCLKRCQPNAKRCTQRAMFRNNARLRRCRSLRTPGRINRCIRNNRRGFLAELKACQSKSKSCRDGCWTRHYQRVCYINMLIELESIKKVYDACRQTIEKCLKCERGTCRFVCRRSACGKFRSNNPIEAKIDLKNQIERLKQKAKLRYNACLPRCKSKRLRRTQGILLLLRVNNALRKFSGAMTCL